ncbi:hydrocarbon-binding protein [Iningainema tapete]|uniref:Hydrocarbon-binding protein n=1 Tax=Iningainema tapete BLCC-T55 TaxID=2748662 RepID=A0A8J6XI60_9CYAN|nr:hydrocarbon-binding protein [Iningainema tapete]MBD2774863.1 hydrocarbon-binding protein [Iningainema tapete BLCC-T55]
MLRPILGDYSSIICFKSAVVGIEDTLGEKAAAIALTAAGRSRGKLLAQELGLTGSSLSFEDITYKVGSALGNDGTRLCIINSIVKEGNVIKVYTSETFCSAGEPQGSPRKCTYTLGAVWGVLEQTLGKRLQGRHSESVLRGSEYDVFEFTEF